MTYEYKANKQIDNTHSERSIKAKESNIKRYQINMQEITTVILDYIGKFRKCIVGTVLGTQTFCCMDVSVLTVK